MAYEQLPIEKLSDFLAKYEAQRYRVLQRTADYFWKYTRFSGHEDRETAINAFTIWEILFQ